MPIQPVPARRQRPQVRGAVREGLGARGPSAQRGRTTVFVPLAGLVEPQLRFELDVEADGAKYGLDSDVISRVETYRWNVDVVLDADLLHAAGFR